jgi:hypothetical protein
MLYGDVGMQGKSDRVEVACAYVTCGNRQDGRSCQVKLVERKFMSFGRRYHRNTDAQYHTAIATLAFSDIARPVLLEFLGLISLTQLQHFASTACTASILVHGEYRLCDEP